MMNEERIVDICLEKAKNLKHGMSIRPLKTYREFKYCLFKEVFFDLDFYSFHYEFKIHDSEKDKTNWSHSQILFSTDSKIIDIFGEDESVIFYESR